MGQGAQGILQGEITENMKSQVIQKMIEDKEKIDEKYRQETEKILKMKQITVEHRKELLEKLKKNEALENQEREKKKLLLEKIAHVKEKIIQGDKQKEEFLRVQKELHEERQQRKMMEQEKLKLREEAENTEIEKGILEKKYASQMEEFREKEVLSQKVKARYNELKTEYEEIVESCNIDLKNLEEENQDLEEQIKINEQILKSYFDEETIEKISQSLTYTSYCDSFKFNGHDEEVVQLFNSFVNMKNIQERDFSTEDSGDIENYLLFGDENPFVDVKIN